ncbi:hypothetical protein SK128_008354, partial [Halocaridina rubra]
MLHLLDDNLSDDRQISGANIDDMPQRKKRKIKYKSDDLLNLACNYLQKDDSTEMGTLTRNSAKINECRNVDILPASRPMSAASSSTSHDDGDSMNHSTTQMEPLTPYFHKFQPQENIDNELKKITSSKRSGTGTDDIPETSLWYNEEMSFLIDQEVPSDSLSTLDEEECEDVIDDH